MNPIIFTQSESNGLFRYEFAPKDGSESLKTTFTQNPKIFKAWSEAAENPQYLKYCVSNFGSGENIAISLALLWHLLKDHNLHAITPYETEGTASIIQKNWAPIKWEYDIEHEYTDLSVGYIKRDLGFVRARSPLMIQHGKQVQKISLDETGLFDIANREDYFKLPQAGFGDVVSTVNIFGFSTNRKIELVKQLNDDSPPELTRILGRDDIFAAVQFGVDMGYFDYLVIYSKASLEPKLGNLAHLYNNAVARYEEKILQITTLAEFDALLEQLLSPKNNENGA